MLLIEGNVIYLTRGDDAEFSIEIRDEDGTAYELQKGDVLEGTTDDIILMMADLIGGGE